MTNTPFIIARHGGGCCGVTHIRGLAGVPTSTAEAFIHPRRANPDWFVPDAPKDPFWWQTDLPEETYGDRLLRAIQFVETHIRVGGLIEITTATLANKEEWRPFLEEIGFVPHAVSGVNSNTRHEITVWILDTNDEAHKKLYDRLKPLPGEKKTKAETAKTVFASTRPTTNQAAAPVAPAPVARTRVRA